MKKLLMLITAIAVMFGGLAFMAPAANADGGTESGSEITSESSSSSADSAQVTSSAHAGGTITAKTVAYVKAKGTPKAKQTNCRTIKKAASYWTSYINSSGKEVWHWKWYPKGKRFCKIGGVMRDPVCHNKVKIGVPKAKKPRGIIITGKINVITSFKFVAEAEAKVTATAKATAKAWCQNEWTYAEAYASANAYSYAYARARATGTTKAKAEAAARGAASQLSLSASFKGNVEVDAKAKAKATATADAYAKVTCGEGPPPAHDECPNIPGDQPEGYDCNPPEEEAPAPTFAQFREINDVYVSATTDHCVTVDFPDGNSGTVHWTAKYGSFATSTKAAQDMVQVCSTYKAPSEVPSSGTDTITVTATDSVTGKSVTQTTDPFVIKAMPATP